MACATFVEVIAGIIFSLKGCGKASNQKSKIKRQKSKINDLGTFPGCVVGLSVEPSGRERGPAAGCIPFLTFDF
jgi:hypothetical protein